MKFFISIFLLLYLTIPSCKQESHHPEMNHSLPSGIQTGGSLFELDENWILPNHQTFRFGELKGKPFLISMFYSSCQSVCPRIVDDLKRISGEIKKKTNQSPKIILVSFDPEKDTPEKLNEYLSEMKLDSNWYLLHGKEEQVRTLSVILGINYKKLGSGDFNHSAIISLISKEGNIQTRVEGTSANIDSILNSFWKTAFRPFFLFGSIHIFTTILLWLSILFSIINSPFSISSVEWHSYEMIFGFARAILIGFLFTAAQNWTGKILLREKRLQLIFILWFFGRFGFIQNTIISSVAIGLDIVCDFFVLYYLIPPLLQKGQEHNRIIITLQTLFSLCHLLVILSLLQYFPSGNSLHFIHMGVFTVICYIMIIGGRIIPFFTTNAVKAANPTKNIYVEKIISVLCILFLASEFSVYYFPRIYIFSSLSCFVLFIVHLLRLCLWKPWVTRKTPILWVLNLGYLWMILGFLCLGLYHLGKFPLSSSLHIFGLGAIGVFIYGMICRVSLGHTGRKIQASKPIVFAYILINISVLIRVCLPWSGEFFLAYSLSGLGLVASFFIFLLSYAMILILERPDGKIG